MDSGAGAHLSPHLGAFDKDTMYVPSPPVHLVTANGSRTTVELRGDAHVVTSYGGIETMIVLKNAMYVPNCAHVLISGSLAHDAGLRQDLTSGVMRTSTGDIISRLGFHKSRVLVLEGANAAPTAGHVRRLRTGRRVDERSAAQWTVAAAPFADREVPSSRNRPTSSANKFASLSDSAVDVHDTYNESWCAAPAAVSRPANFAAARANEVVTLVVTRQLPAKDYAAMDAGRVTQVLVGQPRATQFLAIGQRNSMTRVPPLTSTPRYAPTAGLFVVSSPSMLPFDKSQRWRPGSVVCRPVQALRHAHKTKWFVQLLGVCLPAQVVQHAHDFLWAVLLLVVHYVSPRVRVWCLHLVVGLPVAPECHRPCHQLRRAHLHNRRPPALTLHTGQHSSPAAFRETDKSLRQAVTVVRCPKTTQLAMTTAMMTAA